MSDDIVALLNGGEGLAFRMKDDDGGIMYSGRYYGPDTDLMFSPLDDFGMPNAGATSIEYQEHGVWKQL